VKNRVNHRQFNPLKYLICQSNVQSNRYFKARRERGWWIRDWASLFHVWHNIWNPFPSRRRNENSCQW